MSWALDHSRAEQGTLLVLIAIAGATDSEGRGSFQSQATIARQARLGDRQVRNCLTELQALGEIAAVGKTKAGTIVWEMPHVAPLPTVDVGAEPPTNPEAHFHPEDISARKPSSGQPGSPLPTNRQLTVSREEPNGSSSVELAGLKATKEAVLTTSVNEAFAYWREKCGHPQAKPTRDRLAKVRARLAEGYSLDAIREAIDGAASAAFVNEQGKRFDDLELICRSGSKLEDFIGRATQKAPPMQISGEEYAEKMAAKSKRESARQLASLSVEERAEFERGLTASRGVA